MTSPTASGTASRRVRSWGGCGARLLAPATMYDGRNRGGVRNIRYAQFRPATVRVVIDLDALKDYQTQRREGQVRVQIGSERTAFATWTSQPGDPAVGGAGRTALPAPTPAVPAPAAEVTTPTAGAPLAIDQYLALHRREAAQAQAPRITVTWDGADIAGVTAGLAALRRRTIIVSKNVTGKVTAEIKNQPWD